MVSLKSFMKPFSITHIYSGGSGAALTHTGYFEPKRFSHFYSTKDTMVLFGRKYDI